MGFFVDPLAAAMAYDKAVKKFNPNWDKEPSTKLNFPPGTGTEAAYRFGTGMEVADLAHAAHAARASPFVLGSPLSSGASASSRPGSVAPMSGRGSTARMGLREPFLALQQDMFARRVSAGTGGNASPAAAFAPGSSSMSPLQLSMGNVMLGASPAPLCPTSGTSILAPLLQRPLSSGANPARQNAHSVHRVHSAVGLREREEKSQSAEAGSQEKHAQAWKRRQEKGALEHVLDDKSSLTRTPSPAHAATPKNTIGYDIYTYTERERERERHVCVCVYQMPFSPHALSVGQTGVVRADLCQEELDSSSEKKKNCAPHCCSC